MAEDQFIRRGLVPVPAPTPAPATMTPEGSGTSVISNEELARRERFFKLDKSGKPTFLGKQPDATLRPGEAVVALDPAGKARVVNSAGVGTDAAFLQRHAQLLSRLGKGGGAAGFLLGIPGLVDLLREFERNPFLLRRGVVPMA